MGHVRGQSVPKSQRWQEIVELLDLYPERTRGAESIEEIAGRVIENVKSRYRKIHQDESVIRTFRYLLLLCASGKHQDPNGFLKEMGVDLSSDPSRLEILSAGEEWIEETLTGEESREYKGLAIRALADTLNYVHDTQKFAPQGSFFDDEDTKLDIWKEVSDGSGFTNVAQTFFARFTERYLKYFLDREASNTIPQIEQRERFQAEISNHADETAKITRQFSAGWYNKNVERAPPSSDNVKGFLWTAFGKIRDELSREEAQKHE